MADIVITEDAYTIRWSGSVEVPGQGTIELELGFSKAGGRDQRDDLRKAVAEVLENARLGRLDLIRYARKDRHKRDAGTTTSLHLPTTKV